MPIVLSDRQARKFCRQLVYASGQDCNNNEPPPRRDGECAWLFEEHLQLTAELEEAGYIVNTFTLDAVQYEVPQKRRRILVIACKGGIEFRVPAPVAQFDPRLCNLLLTEPEVCEFYWMTAMKTNYYLEREKLGLRYVHFIFSDDKQHISNTIRASYMKSRGQEALILYPNSKCRMLTESECAAIQSFPHDYLWPGSHSSIYRQIGNAVPPKFAYHIGLAIKRALH